jgi:beta-exotoxin I transport system permease protein
MMSLSANAANDRAGRGPGCGKKPGKGRHDGGDPHLRPALFGVTGSISTSGGWLDGNLYADFFPLTLLLLTIGYGAVSLADQDEDGTLCLLTVLPVRRAAIVTQKIAALAAQAAVLAAAVAVCVIIGRSFQLSVTVAAAFLMAVDFSIIAMAAGARTGRRGTAIGTGSALAAASYLISSLTPVVSWLSPARNASLLYWSVGNSQLTREVSAASYAVLLATGLLAGAAAVLAFRRLDVR